MGQGGTVGPGRSLSPRDELRPASLPVGPCDDTLVHGHSFSHICRALWLACAAFQDPVASLLPLEALTVTDRQNPEGL